MMKRNAIARTLIASAVLAVVGVAQAGTVSATKRTVANESFGSAYTSASALFVPDTSYTFNTPAGIVVNPGGQVTVNFTMAGGRWASSGALAAGNAVVTSLPAGLTAGTPAITTVSTTSDTVTVVLTNTLTNANVTIGIGAKVTLTSVGGATRFQATNVVQGTPVSVTGNVVNTASNTVLEATSSSATLITYAQAVTGAFTASTETKKIDLTATPAASALTTGVAVANRVQFGKVKFVNNPDVTPVDLDVSAAALAETNIVAGAPAFGAGFTVTVGVSSGAFTAKQGVALYADATCNTALAGGAVTQNPTTASLTAATTSVVLTNNAGASAANTAADLATTGVFVCGDYSTIGANAVISSFTPTISASYTKASTAYTGDTLASNTGYALTTNGQTVDVRSYIPAGTAGYTSYVRVINSGTVDASVTGQWLNQDGTTSTGAALGTIKAGGAITWTSAQIEGLIGAPSAAANSQVRPRLRLTAPTSGLQAQSFFLNPDNSFSTMHGAD